mmetsp:Transcript_26608/g.65918  ORF Transcript_26608/g.65918 Transcript_26608/m.65918 type:complete len:211 (+) Transcript_26608:1187-1819(+)
MSSPRRTSSPSRARARSSASSRSPSTSPRSSRASRASSSRSTSASPASRSSSRARTTRSPSRPSTWSVAWTRWRRRRPRWPRRSRAKRPRAGGGDERAALFFSLFCGLGAARDGARSTHARDRGAAARTRPCEHDARGRRAQLPSFRATFGAGGRVGLLVGVCGVHSACQATLFIARRVCSAWCVASFVCRTHSSRPLGLRSTGGGVRGS